MQHLTDVSLQLRAAAHPATNAWRPLHRSPAHSAPAPEIEHIERRLPLPPSARGVVVDSGRSVRFVITGDPVGERVLEFTLGEASSFDCWIREDWVREGLVRDLDDALGRARRIIAELLDPQPHADNQTSA
jgi:hypothetical protein